MLVGGDGEADGADAGVEVEDVFGGDVFGDFGKSHFVNWEVNLEKAVGGIRIFATKNGISEIGEGGVGLTVYI